VQVFLHAEIAERELHGPLVQQAEHEPFAVNHGITETRMSTSRPPVRNWMRPSCGRRRSAMFKPRHDLQAADDGRLEAVDLGRHRLEMQHAVDAVAHSQAGLLRLDVYVAGPKLDGFEQDFVDQPHDRRFLGERREFAVGLRAIGQFDAFVAVLSQQAGRWSRCRRPGAS